MAKTLDQRRAEYAFKIVSQVIERQYASDFASLTSKMSSYILTNGLGNTLAFLFSKGKEHHLCIAGLMADWILRIYRLGESPNIQALNDDWIFDTNNIKDNLPEIMKSLVLNIDIYQYAIVTNELLALFGWLKRFSDGMLEKGGK